MINFIIIWYIFDDLRDDFPHLYDQTCHLWLVIDSAFLSVVEHRPCIPICGWAQALHSYLWLSIRSASLSVAEHRLCYLWLSTDSAICGWAWARHSYLWLSTDFAICGWAYALHSVRSVSVAEWICEAPLISKLAGASEEGIQAPTLNLQTGEAKHSSDYSLYYYVSIKRQLV